MFNHIKLGENEHICFKCGKIFQSKHEMMKHIKEDHPTPCYKHRAGKCSHGNNCIFVHEVIDQNLDFQMTQPPPAPPEWPNLPHKNPNQRQDQEMKTMLNQMMNLMKQMGQMMVKLNQNQQNQI